MHRIAYFQAQAKRQGRGRRRSKVAFQLHSPALSPHNCLESSALARSACLPVSLSGLSGLQAMLTEAIKHAHTSTHTHTAASGAERESARVRALANQRQMSPTSLPTAQPARALRQVGESKNPKNRARSFTHTHTGAGTLTPAKRRYS